MLPWIAAAAAVKRHAVIIPETMLRFVQRVLVRQKQARLRADAGKSSGDRHQFDCFWAGSDHKVDTLYRQPSP
jgi:hypothetical protein